MTNDEQMPKMLTDEMNTLGVILNRIPATVATGEGTHSTEIAILAATFHWLPLPLPLARVSSLSGKEPLCCCEFYIEIKNKEKVKAAEFSARDALVTALKELLALKALKALLRHFDKNSEERFHSSDSTAPRQHSCVKLFLANNL